VSYKGIEVKGPFAVRFRGNLVVDSEWDFHFHLSSDDGSRIIIDGQTVVNHDGRHGMSSKRGKLRLKAGSYPIEVQYFDGGGGRGLKLEWRRQAGELGPLGGENLVHYPGTVLKAPANPKGSSAAIAAGKKHFSQYGCAACHDAPKHENQLKAPAFAKLSGGDCSGVSYNLSAEQKQMLKTVIAKKGQLAKPRAAEAEVRHQMARFNCASCHKRGDWAGPSDEMYKIFTSAFSVDMGDMAKLPPNLGKVGDKLTASALEKVMAGHGPYVRPYLNTRMPNYGDATAKALTKAFKAADAKPDTDKLPELIGDQFHDSVAIGERLFGGQGLNCATCHNFGNQKGGMNILNLYTVKDRMTPGGWRRYLANPLDFHNDRMPPFWPKVGDSHNAVTLPGVPKRTAEQQWDAIFRYIQTAKLEKTGGPAIKSELKPAQEPIVFHTFMEGVSPRSITVGNPGGVHVAFDGDQVRLARAWRGRFFNADGTWEGRAGKFMQPLSDQQLVLPPGPAILTADQIGDVWPVPQKHTRNIGGKFMGYRLDAKRRPVFRYKIGNVIVEEQPDSSAALRPRLIRRFTIIPLDGHAEELVLRAAIGKEIKSHDNGFAINQTETVKFQEGTACGPAPKRPPTKSKPAKLETEIRNTKAGAELLARIKIPDHPIHFEVEVSW
jgi:mono/diheme cytochrome c family protein